MEGSEWVDPNSDAPAEQVEMANRGDVKTISHGSDQPISPKTAVSAEAASLQSWESIRRKVEIPCLV